MMHSPTWLRIAPPGHFIRFRRRCQGIILAMGFFIASQSNASAQLSLSLKSSYIAGPHDVAQGGGPQPLVELTICAVPRNAGNPVPNTTVTFSTDQPFVLSLSSTSVTSDTRGRAVIQVKGMYAGGSPTLTARWRFPPGPGGQEIQTSIAIAITADDCQTLNNTPLNGFPGFPNAYTIRWHSLSQFTAEIISGFSSWAATGYVGFTPDPANPQIVFSDAFDNMNEYYGEATLGAPIRSVRLNAVFLSGDPMSEIAPSDYPPLPQNKAALATVTHEIGHTLGLGHNATDRVSLMWHAISHYYVCGTASPTADEYWALGQLY